MDNTATCGATNQAIAALVYNCQYSDVYTPVQLASEKGNHEMVSALADGGANLNATTTGPYGGFTPLGCAIHECHPETVRVLVEKGADPNLKPCTYPVTLPDSRWEAFVATPLFMARKEGCTDIVKILIDGGADHNIRNAKGQTVLHEAVTDMSMDMSMLKCLLDNGADLSATDNKGRTARDIAVAKFNKHGWVGYKESITCIDTHIAQVNSESRMTVSTTRQKGLPEVMDGEIMAFLKH